MDSWLIVLELMMVEQMELQGLVFVQGLQEYWWLFVPWNQLLLPGRLLDFGVVRLL
jgi:hypothetical protein